MRDGVSEHQDPVPGEPDAAATSRGRGTAGRAEILSWTLFDFANTGFYVIIITLVYPTFFVARLAGNNEAVWGRTIAASMLATAAIGPLLGSVADATNRKKWMLGGFTIACVLATTGLYFPTASTIGIAISLVIIANVGFEGGTIFYDAFLPDLAAREHYSRISGYGFAMGYLGSFSILLLILPIIGGENPSEESIRSTFVIAAAFFALFALPLFLIVRERHAPRRLLENPLRVGYRRLRETIAHIRDYRDVRRFLVAYFVYNDSILTVILFAGIFATSELKMSTGELIYFFMIVQGAALVGSLLFGAITNSIGVRQSIAICLLIWIGVVAAAYFVQTAEGFFVIGAIAGIGLGSTQSSSRTMMAMLTPEDRRAEFFGFYDGFFGKASAVMGPLLFGEVAHALGQREAMLVVGGLFLLGIYLIMRVPDVRVTSVREASWQ